MTQPFGHAPIAARSFAWNSSFDVCFHPGSQNSVSREICGTPSITESRLPNVVYATGVRRDWDEVNDRYLAFPLPVLDGKGALQTWEKMNSTTVACDVDSVATITVAEQWWGSLHDGNTRSTLQCVD